MTIRASGPSSTRRSSMAIDRRRLVRRTRRAGLGSQPRAAGRSIVALWRIVDRADFGRRRLDRGARRGHQPARLRRSSRAAMASILAAALVVTPCCAHERRQRLLRRDPAFALARARGRGERLGAARQPVELGDPAARRGDRLGQRCSGLRVDACRARARRESSTRGSMRLGGARRERGITASARRSR